MRAAEVRFAQLLHSIATSVMHKKRTVPVLPTDSCQMSV
jgi:hypothetical protein